MGTTKLEGVNSGIPIKEYDSDLVRIPAEDSRGCALLKSGDVITRSLAKGKEKIVSSIETINTFLSNPLASLDAAGLNDRYVKDSVDCSNRLPSPTKKVIIDYSITKHLINIKGGSNLSSISTREELNSNDDTHGRFEGMDVEGSVDNKLLQEEFKEFVAIFWRTWYQRNRAVYDDIILDAKEIIPSALSLLYEFRVVVQKPHDHRQPFMDTTNVS
ncbi:hypothetical protein ACOSQ4_014831 [Xanthoceras sorbifolium]